MFNLVLAFIAAVGFLASAVCNVLGWLRIDPPGGHRVFVLHVACLALFIPLVFITKRTMPNTGRNNLEQLLKPLPKWVRRAGGILFAYVIVNFICFFYSSSQYPKHQVPLYLEARGFSGHWMVFFGYAALGYFTLARLDREKKKEKDYSAPGPPRS